MQWDVFLCLCSYQRLLQTIAVLEAQRTQAVQDLESLGRHQREALKDPIGFVERLQKKVFLWTFPKSYLDFFLIISNSASIEIEE